MDLRRPKEPKDRIIVPLDVPDIAQAIALVSLLGPYVGFFKIGLEFIWSMAANLLLLPNEDAVVLLSQIRSLAKTIGASRVFVDSKLDDIPNTVAGASAAISRMGVAMFNVHASAGKEAVRAAVSAAKGRHSPSMVLGVTVLTSIAPEECVSIFGDKPDKKVVQFGQMLKDAGADGIICSPQELVPLAEAVPDLVRITPGVRPEWAAAGDQKRIMTPADAIRAGAHLLVIGRPILKPPPEIDGPVEAAKRIAEEIAGALA